jgi:hypothetical protein
LAVACLAGAACAARAAEIGYDLDLPAGQTLAYRVEFEVVHPGAMTVEARWSPPRVLVFRLERPGQRPLRLSGPPPCSWQLDILPEELDRDTPWTLAISGLPSREAARGRLEIDLPGPPETRLEQPRAAPEPLPEPDPWMLPVEMPPGLTHARRRLFDATERFRQTVVGRSTPDAYRWQDGMLRYLAEARDRNASAPSPLDRSTREMFRRIVEAVGQLDRLRLAESEPLAGPAPLDSVRRRAWLTVRDPRFAPTEEQLGVLLVELNRGHAPELEHEQWYSRFLSCLIVCERHFEERARIGAEHASNSELARQQWGRVLAAVDALDALIALP